MPQAKVVSFINYKGGVGKTTSTYHIGCSLTGHHNKKVLFICPNTSRWRRLMQTG